MQAEFPAERPITGMAWFFVFKRLACRLGCNAPELKLIIVSLFKNIRSISVFFAKIFIVRYSRLFWG
jgi:hypothetical protein